MAWRPYRDEQEIELLDRVAALEHDSEAKLDPPPTPEEMHEAELNPWPGHSLAETIKRNREKAASSSAPKQPNPD